MKFKLMKRKHSTIHNGYEWGWYEWDNRRARDFNRKGQLVGFDLCQEALCPWARKNGKHYKVSD